MVPNQNRHLRSITLDVDEISQSDVSCNRWLNECWSELSQVKSTLAIWWFRVKRSRPPSGRPRAPTSTGGASETVRGASSQREWQGEILPRAETDVRCQCTRFLPQVKRHVACIWLTLCSKSNSWDRLWCLHNFRWSWNTEF